MRVEGQPRHACASIAHQTPAPHLKGPVKISTERILCVAAKLTEILVELAAATGGRVRIGSLGDDGLTYWETPDPASEASPVLLSRGSVPAHATADSCCLLTLTRTPGTEWSTGSWGRPELHLT